MKRRLVSLTVVAVALASAPVPDARGAPALVAPSTPARLVARLGDLEPGFGPAGIRSVTVAFLDTGERGALDGSDLLPAASAAKPIWVAAALEQSGVAALEATARGALWSSSNHAAGRAIDMAGGVDAVNRFAQGAGLGDTQIYAWSFDRLRVARSFPGPLDGLNTTSTDDLVRFWELVAAGTLLGEEADAALLRWTKGFKEEPDGNALVTRLPIYIGATASFKMGWLRNGVSGMTDVGSGIFTVPGGTSYVVAVGVSHGTTWAAMAGWVEYVSCVVYSVVAHDALDCVRGRDPRAIRERQAAPSGELEALRVRTGFVSVSGWAADPDAWWRPTRVAVTLDGVVVALSWASPTSEADLFAPRFSREFPFEGGTHEVCAVARNDGNGTDTSIGCRIVTL